MKAAAVLLSVIAAACVQGTPTAPGDARTAAAPNSAAGSYDGVWNGQTSQSQRLTFTILGSRITALDFKFDGTRDDPACLGTGGFGGGGTLGVISNGGFSLTSLPSAARTLAWTLTGRFTSPDTATGTLEVGLTTLAAGPNPACTVPLEATWTAQKSSFLRAE